MIEYIAKNEHQISTKKYIIESHKKKSSEILQYTNVFHYSGIQGSYSETLVNLSLKTYQY